MYSSRFFFSLALRCSSAPRKPCSSWRAAFGAQGAVAGEEGDFLFDDEGVPGGPAGAGDGGAEGEAGGQVEDDGAHPVVGLGDAALDGGVLEVHGVHGLDGGGDGVAGVAFGMGSDLGVVGEAEVQGLDGADADAGVPANGEGVVAVDFLMDVVGGVGRVVVVPESVHPGGVEALRELDVEVADGDAGGEREAVVHLPQCEVALRTHMTCYHVDAVGI